MKFYDGEYKLLNYNKLFKYYEKFCVQKTTC